MKFSFTKIKGFFRDYFVDKTVFVLIAIFLFLSVEPKLHLIEFLTNYFRIGVALLSSSELKDLLFYTCSALIQAYAALIAILYSLISIHLQIRYGHYIIHAIVDRFIKPFIVLGLFSFDSFLVMTLNASESISLSSKHVFLFLIEPIAFISALIFLYTHVVATAKMSPSRMILKLLNPEHLKGFLKLHELYPLMRLTRKFQREFPQVSRFSEYY